MTAEIEGFPKYSWWQDVVECSATLVAEQPDREHGAGTEDEDVGNDDCSAVPACAHPFQQIACKPC